MNRAMDSGTTLSGADMGPNSVGQTIAQKFPPLPIRKKIIHQRCIHECGAALSANRQTYQTRRDVWTRRNSAPPLGCSRIVDISAICSESAIKGYACNSAESPTCPPRMSFPSHKERDSDSFLATRPWMLDLISAVGTSHRSSGRFLQVTCD